MHLYPYRRVAAKKRATWVIHDNPLCSQDPQHQWPEKVIKKKDF
jgi:hypothetical protein